jgi:hypothetical protein
MSSPSASSSASSLRTVDEDTSMPARSTSDFDPTGWPVTMCSSTTRRRISRLREERSMSVDRTGTTVQRRGRGFAARPAA